MYLYGAKKTDKNILFYPFNGFLGDEPDENGEYEKILHYYEPLDERTVSKYDLEFLGTDEPSECESCKISF